MKPLLAMAFVALLLAAGPALSPAAETTGEPGAKTTDTGSDQSSSPPETSSEQGASQEEKSGEKNGSNGNLMQNVTRHRAGACPEGPPCKAGD